MAQQTRLGVSGFPRPPQTFAAKDEVVGVVWTSAGHPDVLFLFTSANWAKNSFLLETMIRQTSGTAQARLYNNTDGAAVASSDLSSTSGTFERKRSSAFTLTDGKEYRVQYGTTAADGGEGYGGKLIHV